MSAPAAFTIGFVAAVAVLPAAAVGQGAATIQQVPAAAAPVGVTPVDPARSSATVQRAGAETLPPPVSPDVLAACQAARAADRPAPRGIDCVKALQVAAQPSTQNAEGTLLDLFGGGTGLSTPVSTSGDGSGSAEQVSRQLSSGDFQGAVGSDAAASVARDRAPPPAANPPPR